MLEETSITSLVFDQTMINFFLEIARKVDMIKEDIDYIFNISFGELTLLEKFPTNIKFFLQDQHNASFECEMSNAMLLIAESQRNKTTCLLAIATLLGYPWDDKNNVRILADEEFVKKGQALRKLLSYGHESNLEINRGSNHLRINFRNGKSTVKYQTPIKGEETSFDLSREWKSFERYMDSLIDVQLVSKGRNFIERVESDILSDLKTLADTLKSNSQQLYDQLTVRGARPLFQQATTPKQFDKEASIRRLESIKKEIQQKEDERNTYVLQRSAIRTILDYHGKLRTEERQEIEKLHRLERELHAAEVVERAQIQYRDRLQHKVLEIEQLNKEYLNQEARKKHLDKAFETLQAEIAELYSKKMITSSPEIDSIREFIRTSNVQGICKNLNKEINIKSIEAYKALLIAIEDDTYAEIPLLPLGDGINSTDSLRAKLKQHLGRAVNIISMNEVIGNFTQYLIKAGISLNITPLDYQMLQKTIADLKNEFYEAEAELIAEKDTAPMILEEQKVTNLKKEAELIKKNLSKQAQEIREKIGETVSTLEGRADSHLEQIWLVGALSHMQELETEVDRVVLRLRKEQYELEQRKQQLEEQLNKMEAKPVDETPERSEPVNRFMQLLSYVRRVVDTSSNTGRDDNLVKNSEIFLDEAGLLEPFKETIDKLITRRCEYYYDNSGEKCKPIPLETVMYKRIDRRMPQFKIGSREIDRVALSGGTESVMTVRSLASRPSSKPFGVALLVDEWGDVEQICEPLYEQLKDINSILFAIFVKVRDISELTSEPVN